MTKQEILPNIVYYPFIRNGLSVNSMTDIFISYSRNDQVWVSKLAAAFEQTGYDVWWDTQLVPEEDFMHTIPAELEKARCVVVVWSKTSVTRKWVRSEASRADNRGVLVPVRCEAAEIPMPLDLLHAADMQAWNGKLEHPAFQKLLQAVSRYCTPSKVNGGNPPPPIPDPPPPKKLPWLPVLLLSVAVGGGGGYYWQQSGESLAGGIPITTGNESSIIINYSQAQTETKAEATIKASQADELAQAKTLLEADDKTQWPNAVSRLTALADKGESEAMYLLGIAYQRGRGTSENLKSSCEQYKKAKDAGHAKAGDTYEKLKDAINDPKICP